MVKLEKADVEYMIENGVGSYLKLMRDAFNPADLFHKFYKYIKFTLIAITKTMVGYYILQKIYDSLGLEKFLLLALAVYIAQKVAKEELRTS